MSKRYTLDGLASTVELGKGGPRVKDSSGVVEMRNAADTAYVITRGLDPVGNNDYVTLGYFNSNAGAGGLPGNIYESLVFYMDPTDRGSYIGSGTTVIDLEGNGTSGTLTTATFGNGGFEFNGSSGDLTFTKGSTLDDIFSGGGTVIAFFQTASDGEASTGRIVTTEGSGGAVGWLMYVEAESSDYLRVTFDRNTDSTDGRWDMDDIGGTRPIRNGSWTCVGISYDDSSLSNDPTMYLNGEGVSNTETQTPLGTVGSDAGEDIVIGNRAADNRTFNGTVGLVLLFERELTAEEHALVFSAFGPRYGSGFRGRPQQTAGLPAADVVIAAGDWSGTTTTAGSDGGDMTVRAGHTDGTGTSTDGGNLFLYAGNTAGSSRVGYFILKGGTGGLGNATDCEVAAGDVNTGNSAGDLVVHGGDNTSSGAAGDLTCRGGDSSTGHAGDLYLTAGSSGGLGDDPGDIFIRSGENGSTLPATGTILISTDRVSGTGGGTGDITIETGENGNNSNPVGTIRLTGGNAAGTGAAGSIIISGGNNTSTSNGDGGDITMTCGTSVDGDGGSFSFTAGDCSSADSNDPAGGFTFIAGDQTSGGSDSGSGGGGFTFTGGSCAKTSTASTGGGFTVTCGASTANSANARGGSVLIEAGDVQSTTAGALAGSLTLRAGANTGAAANTAGSVVIEGGSPDGDSADTGGSVTIEAGGSNTGTGLTNVIGGSIVVEAGSGIGTGRAGGSLSLISGDGNSAGAIDITAGDGLSNANGGTITVTAGAGAGAGGNGQINLRTEDSDAPVSVRTQSTFIASDQEHFTNAQSTSLSASTNTTLVTLGTLTTNGRTMKVEVSINGVDNATDTEVISGRFSQTFYRASGSISSLTAHLSDQQNNTAGGETFGNRVTFTITTSGNDIILRADNASSSNAFTGNFSMWWSVQEGGMAS